MIRPKAADEDICDSGHSAARFADGSVDRFSALAVELVSPRATVIVIASTTAIRAAHDAAPNVPIVSWGSADPVLMGIAKTMARPGGIITGVFLTGSKAKRFELLKEVRPQATRFGYLMNATNPEIQSSRRKQMMRLVRVAAIGPQLRVEWKEFR